MKIKSLIVISLLILFGASTIIDSARITITEPTPIELVKKSSEIEASDSTDELQLFHQHLSIVDTANKSLCDCNKRENMLKTISEGIYRPPKLS
jgi:hypothetical protein